MQLNNYKKCDKCGKLYNTSPFSCMSCNGERTDSTIKIHGDNYDLCPKCTYKILEFLHN